MEAGGGGGGGGFDFCKKFFLTVILKLCTQFQFNTVPKTLQKVCGAKCGGYAKVCGGYAKFCGGYAKKRGGYLLFHKKIGKDTY